MLKILKLHVPKSLLVLAGIEGAIFFVSFFIGLLLSWVEFTGGLSEIVAVLPSASLYTGVLLVTMFSVGAYHRDYVLKRSEIVVRIIFGFVFAFAFLTVVFYSFPILAIWRSVIVIAMIGAFGGMVATRYFALRILDWERLKRRIVVIGVGDQAAKIEALAHGGQPLSFLCLGYVDIGGEEMKVPRSRVIPQVNAPIEFFKERGVDEIVVAVQDRRRRLPVRSLIDCRMSGMVVVDYLTFYAGETGRIDLDGVQPSWFLFSEGFRGSRSYKFLKRIVDVAASLVILIFSLPMILLSCVAIRLEGPGAILHRQSRVGLEGTPFVLLKFRSMRENAEEDGVPRWAAPNDPRITRVGAFLRRSRIDELPQLINVLKGEMSFVGPRPERAYFTERFCEELPFYGDRHSVKPGLTGWAQLHYGYGASAEDARMKLQYDLYYVKYCGFVLDCLIILQTVRVIIWPHAVR